MASGIVDVGPGTIELVWMWVGPAIRGHGVADALIGRVLKRGSGRAREIRLAVMPSNDRAVFVYRRHGFAPISSELGDALPDVSAHELLISRTVGAQTGRAAGTRWSDAEIHALLARCTSRRRGRRTKWLGE